MNDHAYDGGTCSCGSAWFRLEPDAGTSDALVCVDKRGFVTGFTGGPVCSECGTPWVPPRERLRVVQGG